MGYITKYPFLSVITPTLNSADSIEKCLISVAKQTFKDLEHLIIDGLSSDETLNIVRKYQSQYAHIRLISERDIGIYDAMNKGIKLARGNWLYFLGSDDKLLDSNVLSNIFVTDLINKYDIIYGNVISSRFNGRYDNAFDQDKILIKNICHQSIFFKCNIFNETGYFNLKYKSLSDWDHNMKWILNPLIRKTYYEIDVAEYSDGGFSSVTTDDPFQHDKLYNYLKYGIQTFTYKKSVRIVVNLIKKSLKQGDFKRIVNILSIVLLNFIQAIYKKK